MSEAGDARKGAPAPLIRRAHTGPIFVAVPGGTLLLPPARSAEQARAQRQAFSPDRASKGGW